MAVQSLIKRKVTVTYVTTLVTATSFACFHMFHRVSMENPYHLGGEFVSWLLIYSMYVGVIVVIYGNLVSLGLEYVHKKWFVQYTWLYILLHGLFGLFNGFLFQATELALAGMVVALFYALIDRWLSVREKEQRSIKMFFLFPVVICGLLSGYFQIISEPLPPFTMEDAVEWATDDDGNMTENFPKKMGKWNGAFDNYYVERETSAKEIGKEKYIVMFTESWEKGMESGTWSFSYKVERGSLSAYGSEGNKPPYY